MAEGGDSSVGVGPRVGGAGGEGGLSARHRGEAGRLGQSGGGPEDEWR